MFVQMQHSPHKYIWSCSFVSVQKSAMPRPGCLCLAWLWDQFISQRNMNTHVLMCLPNRILKMRCTENAALLVLVVVLLQCIRTGVVALMPWNSFSHGRAPNRIQKLHVGMKMDRIRVNITDIIFVFIFVFEYGVGYV